MSRRATCLEFGMAQQFSLNIRASSPASIDPSTPAEAETWLVEAGAAHTAAACRGLGRGYRDVSRTLVDFDQRMNLGSWPIDLWRATSGLGHHLMPHRFARVVDGTVIWGHPLDAIERMTLLDRLFKVFANFYQYVVVVLDSAELPSYHQRSAAVVAQMQSGFATLSES